MPPLHLIYARAANGVIGKDNRLPWHLPQDLAHFKQLTQGCAVIMGRKTWDSLPPHVRPLPGRSNIVLTRNSGWHAAGAQRAASQHEAIALCDARQIAWVIGGAQIYAEALPLADCVEVTEIDQDFDGDAHAPTLDAAWVETRRSRQTSSDGLRFSFVTYARAS
ncbi:dihydrofolate reductase [Verminephrobacter aporrectodeae subsp. tuberculatae]|uniref:Dihydrofolate reductase n=1 Tax=Verminephrobacter aporrectodeae subsp. tuberculatae TaxID=1110392 RepID=A0ABT3KX20_9BURK|nr:dihydrofolate reductase [Verminephrobacter aporrectodeae]MCW5322892.1 dihydrofolate reductase [Verminephrobacter aporrectodeae subsp. tuberculatae]